MAIDPSGKVVKQSSSHLLAVVDSDKEEFLFSELTNASHTAIDLEMLEKLMGAALSSGKAVHAHMLAL